MFCHSNIKNNNNMFLLRETKLNIGYLYNLYNKKIN